MTATLPYIEEKYREFNLLMFSGQLPPVPIELSRARTFIGALTSKRKRNWLGRHKHEIDNLGRSGRGQSSTGAKLEPRKLQQLALMTTGEHNYDYKLKISTRFDLPELELEDIIIHEMIHYYIAVNKLKDTSAHGRVFRQMMKDINENYGRHITISHRLTEEQKQQQQDNTPKYHKVAIVTFKNGKTGVKVLPKNEYKQVYYITQVRRSPKIESITTIETTDPYFNRFPVSSALNVVFVDKETLNEHINSSYRL